MHPIEAAVAKAVARHEAPSVFVGFSGGLDSTALLLAAVNALGARAVTALHVNHQLHERADFWEQQALATCSTLGAAIEHARIVVPPGNLEAQARAARYRFYGESLPMGGLLLLGHHAQDDVETTLLRLVQGRGFVAMPADGKVGRGRFTRPLLEFTKAEIHAYVAGQGIAWSEDPSNFDRAFDRNFLRHEIVPKLAERWPGVAQNIIRVTRDASASAELLLEEMASKSNVMPIAGLPDAATKRIAWLRAFLASRGHFGFSDKALGEFGRQLATAQSCALPVDESLIGGYRRRLVYEPVRPNPPSRSIELVAAEQCEDLGWATLRLGIAAAGAADGFRFPGRLEVRFRRGGECIRAARRGATKTVKALLAEHGVPTWRRAAFPLLYDDDELVCIPGVAVADRAQSAHAGAVWCRAQLQPVTVIGPADEN